LLLEHQVLCNVHTIHVAQKLLDNDNDDGDGYDVNVLDPGRIAALIEEGKLMTSAVRLFILDEADKLLDRTFEDQLQYERHVTPWHWCLNR
jgi:superfamily II DNA/RNA helicase